MLCVPGKYHAIFFFLIVSVSGGFETLPTVFPEALVTCSLDCSLDKIISEMGILNSKRSSHSTFHTSPGGGGGHKPMGHVELPMNSHGARRLMRMSGHVFQLGQKVLLGKLTCLSTVSYWPNGLLFRSQTPEGEGSLIAL
ncbi:hypothetical protein HJG60_011276 [Phyllostomus discolor]|uniref:Uncharacterized protein n=1 Tax=Phyllostomus discolor TaxID=89673 RepID=A0A833ZXC5_9CHIR|nr:hypothetical protein HJG60_011276 [Phyllostomus discolor]